MKLFFTYLILSILLVVCCLEKKFASSVREPEKTVTSSHLRFFEGRFAVKDKSVKMSSLRMKLNIMHSFVKGSYRPDNSEREVSLFGSVNSQNDLIMVESFNGKTTGTFKGKIQKAENHLLRLSGVWSGVNNDGLCRFSLDEVR